MGWPPCRGHGMTARGVPADFVGVYLHGPGGGGVFCLSGDYGGGEALRPAKRCLSDGNGDLKVWRKGEFGGGTFFVFLIGGVGFFMGVFVQRGMLLEEVGICRRKNALTRLRGSGACHSLSKRGGSDLSQFLRKQSPKCLGKINHGTERRIID